MEAYLHKTRKQKLTAHGADIDISLLLYARVTAVVYRSVRISKVTIGTTSLTLVSSRCTQTIGSIVHSIRNGWERGRKAGNKATTGNNMANCTVLYLYKFVCSRKTSIVLFHDGTKWCVICCDVENWIPRLLMTRHLYASLRSLTISFYNVYLIKTNFFSCYFVRVICSAGVLLHRRTNKQLQLDYIIQN